MSRGFVKLAANATGALIGVAVLALFLNGVGALASLAQAATAELESRITETEDATVVRVIDHETGVVCYYLKWYKKGISCVQFKERE